MQLYKMINYRLQENRTWDNVRVLAPDFVALAAVGATFLFCAFLKTDIQDESDEEILSDVSGAQRHNGDAAETSFANEQA
jgi:hypothetical protein